MFLFGGTWAPYNRRGLRRDGWWLLMRWVWSSCVRYWSYVCLTRNNGKSVRCDWE